MTNISGTKKKADRKKGNAQIYEAIESLDLEAIATYLHRKQAWTTQRTAAAIAQYKQFLYVIITAGARSKHRPERDVDEVWHTHILHTKKYCEDCQMIAGRYLHHLPDLPPEKTEPTAAHAEEVNCCNIG